MIVDIFIGILLSLMILSSIFWMFVFCSYIVAVIKHKKRKKRLAQDRIEKFFV